MPTGRLNKTGTTNQEPLATVKKNDTTIQNGRKLYIAHLVIDFVTNVFHTTGNFFRKIFPKSLEDRDISIPASSHLPENKLFLSKADKSTKENGIDISNDDKYPPDVIISKENIEVTNLAKKSDSLQNGSTITDLEDLASINFDPDDINEIHGLIHELNHPDEKTKTPRTRLKRKLSSIIRRKAMLLEQLSKMVIARLEYKKILYDECDINVFSRELFQLLQDVRGRNISFNAKKEELENRPKGDYTRAEQGEDNRVTWGIKYKEHYKEIQQYDQWIEDYLASGSCPTWNTETPLYRGGDADLERKHVRNITKGKSAFRSEYINRGGLAYGSGQYVTDKLEYAQGYASNKPNPVMSTFNLKESLPVVSPGEFESFIGKIPHNFNIKTREYLERFSKHEFLFYADTINEAAIYTLKSGNSIENATMKGLGDVIEDPSFRTFGDLSMQRLNKSGQIIGNPEKFQEVSVNETKLETTDFIAEGYGENTKLSVMKHEDCYVVAAPDKDGVFILVKQNPHSLKSDIPTFILEPPTDFLFKRKEEKVEQIMTDTNIKKLEEKTTVFIQLIKPIFDLMRIDRIEELEDYE